MHRTVSHPHAGCITQLVTHTPGAQCYYYLRGRPRAILLFLQRLLLFGFTSASSLYMTFTSTAFAFMDYYFYLLICYFFEAPTHIRLGVSRCGGKCKTGKCKTQCSHPHLQTSEASRRAPFTAASRAAILNSHLHTSVHHRNRQQCWEVRADLLHKRTRRNLA